MTTHPRWLRVLALLLGLSLVAAACGDDDDGGDAAEDDASSQDGGTVVFASDQEPDGWNINTSASSSLALGQIVELVYPAAFRITPDFEVVMDEDLLTSAEMVSEDPQVIEYVIDPDASWSDGTPISADDFEFLWTMSNGSNPDVDTASTVGYELIESVEGSDDGKTVTVAFSSPYAEWRSLFADLLPAHLISELGDGDPVVGWNEGLADPPEFSGGPFRLVDHQPEQSVTLVPNEEFWGEQPSTDELVVRFDVDNAGIPAALENDEIDMAYPQPQLDLVEQVEEIEGVESVINFGLEFEHLDFNLANSHLAKPEVREAIGFALDREAIVDRTVGQFSDEASVLNNRIFLTNQPNHEAHGDDYQSRDVDGAEQRLDEAGYDCSAEVCTHPEDGELSLRLSTTAGNQLREDTQLIIQEQLAEAGIEVTIDNLEGNAVFSKFFPDSGLRADQDYDMALFAWTGEPFPSATGELYISPGPDMIGLNSTGYSNPEMEALYDQAFAETDSEVAAELYNQIDEMLWEDLPTIPLYQKPTFLPHRSSIEGVQDNATTAGPLWNAEEWTLAS
ncbi:MAG: ABC transporter family substrate-binding protein [Acidimicrobiales bacterium]|nr:ABC transporter family substrate-binding protein [Acidimicrobiales bacterium]